MWYKSFQSTLSGWQAYNGSQDGAFTDITTSNCDGSSGRIADIAVCAAGLFACAFYTGTSVKVVAATVSGVTITAGSEVTVDTALSIQYVSIAALSATKVIVAWSNGSTCYVRTYNITGTVLTPDAGITTLDSGGDKGPVVSAFSATRAVVVYGASSEVRAKGVTLGTGTITPDTNYEVVSTAGAFVDAGICTSSSTKAIVAYGTLGASPVKLRVLTDTGTDIDKGNEASIALYAITGENGRYYVGVDSNGNFLVSAPRDYAYDMAFCTVSGTAVTAPSTFDPPPYFAKGFCWAQTQFGDSYFVGLGLEKGNSSSAVAAVVQSENIAGQTDVTATSGGQSAFAISGFTQCVALSTVAVVALTSQNASNPLRAKIIHT